MTLPRSMTREEILGWLLASDATELFLLAHQTRIEALGEELQIRAIIEISNRCRVDCHYCGLRASNARCERFQLTHDEILSRAQECVAAGFQTVILQSGEEYLPSPEPVTRLVSNFRREFPATALTLSLGEHPDSHYHEWALAGADRYLLKFETSDAARFARLRPGRTLEARRHCLDTIRKVGMAVGSGFMVGLPGQTFSDLAGDLSYLAALKPEMAGIGPFIPHPDTPLRVADMATLPGLLTPDHLTQNTDRVELTLRAIAIARLLLPRCHLPATTALTTMDPSATSRALGAGANVLMKDVTPPQHSRQYEIYPGRPTAPGDVNDAYRAALAFQAHVQRRTFS
jgi:biotin synthase